MEAEDDIGAWAILNRGFHQTLCHAAGASRLVTILQGLHAADALSVGVGLRMAPTPSLPGTRIIDGCSPLPDSATRPLRRRRRCSPSATPSSSPNWPIGRSPLSRQSGGSQ